ncbi:MAG: RluA family pseudouridine synthase [Candidatus Saccharibacteria bacterium]
MSKKTIANKSESPVRADVLIANAYPEYSRSALSKLFIQDSITLEKMPIKAGYKVRPEGKIMADISNLQRVEEIIELPIIFEDKNVIVIDKPIGVISHARGKYWDEASVASFVRSKVANNMEGERAGIVHRLDRATSGVMICAKNSETLSFLQKQFSQHKTKKVYIALIGGTLDPAEAIIDVPVGRNPKKPQTFRPDPNGKNASTSYKVLKTNTTFSLLELKPTTGRTHQLRVHLKYLKHPILGDELYGSKPADRLYLHAKSLEITLPGGKRTTFVSELPICFEEKFK